MISALRAALLITFNQLSNMLKSGNTCRFLRKNPDRPNQNRSLAGADRVDPARLLFLFYPHFTHAFLYFGVFSHVRCYSAILAEPLHSAVPWHSVSSRTDQKTPRGRRAVMIYFSHVRSQ